VRYAVEAINTVIFQKAWTPIFESLSDEEAGQLIKALYSFMNGEKPKIDGTLKAIFLSMADQIEQSARKYCRKVYQDFDEEGDEE